jgi:hypothetical protein
VEERVTGRVLALGAGALLVAAALFAAWLGRGFLALPDEAARENAVWVGSVKNQRQDVSASVQLASRLDRRGSSRAFDAAVSNFRSATVIPRGQLSPPVAAVDAEASIAKLDPRLHSPQEKAQALVMQGILLALSAGNGAGSLGNGQGTGGNLLINQAANDFQDAVVLDPQNEDAKVDLELLLQQVAKTKARGHSHGQGSKSSKRHDVEPPSPATKRPDAPQASYSDPGTGY